MVILFWEKPTTIETQYETQIENTNWFESVAAE